MIIRLTNNVCLYFPRLAVDWQPLKARSPDNSAWFQKGHIFSFNQRLCFARLRFCFLFFSLLIECPMFHRRFNIDAPRRPTNPEADLGESPLCSSWSGDGTPFVRGNRCSSDTAHWPNYLLLLHHGSPSNPKKWIENAISLPQQ